MSGHEVIEELATKAGYRYGEPNAPYWDMDRHQLHTFANELRVALAQNAQGEAPVDKRATGVYHKYNVTRTDGSDFPGGKHDGCEYFVLHITHDPFAKPAAAAYADACESEYPVLAADMRRRYAIAQSIAAGVDERMLQNAQGDGMRARIGCDSESEWFVELVGVSLHTVRTAKVFDTREKAEAYLKGINLWLEGGDSPLPVERARVPIGIEVAIAHIQQKADAYAEENCGVELDTGATTYHYGQSGEDYHHGLLELVDELQAIAATPQPESRS